MSFCVLLIIVIRRLVHCGSAEQPAPQRSPPEIVLSASIGLTIQFAEMLGVA